MANPTAGQVREYLAGVAAGSSATAPKGLYEQMSQRGAVSGSAQQPQLTAVGTHVLQELQLRAYRVDAMPLDRLSEELAAVTQELDTVAHTAEYFLAEIGPLTPPDAVPFMRISAAGLANRRTSPEDMAEVFRNTWGMVEVMAGDGRDRLLAAELLVRSNVPVSRLYAHMMNTMELLEKPGTAVEEPVATAALLHLFPTPGPDARLDSWKQWREVVTSDEAAAVLAGVVAPDGPDRLRAVVQALAQGGNDPVDAERAGVFLFFSHANPLADVPRVRELAAELTGRLPAPLVAAAVLVSRHSLSAAELADWVTKATAIAKNRKLAPTDPELAAIATALVEGISPDRFAGRAPPPAVTGDESTHGVLTLLALHAWVYRPILEPAVAA